MRFPRNKLGTLWKDPTRKSARGRYPKGRFAMAVAAAAAAAAVGTATVKKGWTTAEQAKTEQAQLRDDVNLVEIDDKVCRSNSQSEHCIGVGNRAAPVSPSASGQAAAKGATAHCPPVESYVKEVAVEVDTTWSELQKVKMATQARLSSSASAEDVAQNSECVAALQEPLANYDMLKRRAVNVCRNIYDEENKNLIANKNLLAFFKNRARQNPSCRTMAAALGWDHADAVAGVSREREINAVVTPTASSMSASAVK